MVVDRGIGLILGLGLILLACSSSPMRFPSTTVNTLSSASPTPDVVRRSGDGVFVKTTGWALPEKERFNSKSLPQTQNGFFSDGSQIVLSCTIFTPKNPVVVVDEPFRTIGENLGSYEIDSLVECCGNNLTFLLEVFAHQISENKGSENKTRHSFFYRYYDEDGDGLFEKLVTDSSEVFVPTWVRDKRD